MSWSKDNMVEQIANLEEELIEARMNESIQRCSKHSAQQRVKHLTEENNELKRMITKRTKQLDIAFSVLETVQEGDCCCRNMAATAMNNIAEEEG